MVVVHDEFPAFEHWFRPMTNSMTLSKSQWTGATMGFSEEPSDCWRTMFWGSAQVWDITGSGRHAHDPLPARLARKYANNAFAGSKSTIFGTMMSRQD